MSDQEYSKWLIQDTWEQVSTAIAIYSVVLIAFWVLVG